MSNKANDDINTIDPTSKLSAEDLERVKHVTSTGVNATERKPFKVWALLISIVVFIFLLGQLSILIADLNT